MKPDVRSRVRYAAVLDLVLTLWTEEHKDQAHRLFEEVRAAFALQSDDANITAAMALVSRVLDGAAPADNAKENVAGILFDAISIGQAS